MIKSINDIIYNRLKNNIGFHRSEKFKEWFHVKHPQKTMHHVCGSYGGLKTSDYFSIPLTAEEHIQADLDRSDFCVDNLDKIINVMQDYIIYLEDKCQDTPGC